MLKDKLTKTANNLLDKFGDTIVFTKKEVAGQVYNPITDEYEGIETDISIQTKGYFRKQSYGELKAEDSHKISRVCGFAYNEEVKDIDNTYKLNGNTIVRLDKQGLQDGTVFMYAYIGL